MSISTSAPASPMRCSVNPRLQTLIVSAKTGEGLAAFVAWIEASAARRAADMARG